MKTVLYSVIIPTFNEQHTIADTIDGVLAILPGAEIIVCDASPTKETLWQAGAADITVTSSEPSRGKQCNLGAELASGDILLFLHADTTLPYNAAELLFAFFSLPENQAATFRLKFDVDHILFDTYSFLSKFDSVYTRFGDTCIVFRKDFFNRIGKFPDYAAYEDVEILRRAREKTKIGSLPGFVRTSARRKIMNGLVKQQFLNFRLISSYLLGFSASRLSKIYHSSVNKKGHNSAIIFAKYPHPGKVKTRLAATLGEKSAVKLYKLFAEKLIKLIRHMPDMRKYIFHPDEEDGKLMRRWGGIRFFYGLQKGDDLGIRMKNAFKMVFSHGAKKAVIVGTDVPDITRGIIREAFQSLDTCDLVIGPSLDGGYYLLGMKQPNEELFQDISWSTASVYVETLRKISRQGKSCFILPALIDVDSEADLKRWIQESRQGSQKRIKKGHKLESIEKETGKIIEYLC